MVRQTRLDRLEQDVGELLARSEREGPGDLDEYRDDPVGFVREVVGDEPWSMQVEVAEAVRDYPQVSVRSCHAAGKDWLAARLALWWAYARRGLAVITGPTATQVEEIVMRGEVRAAFRRSGLPGELHVRALRPRGGQGEAGILAKTATGVSALTGFHDARVLFVITEAQDPDIAHSWDAAFACATGSEDRILTLGNPTQPSGRFYRAHRASSDWRAVKIAASDIPNVREGETVVPGLLTRQGVDRFASEYGERSGFYQSRVLAEFPAEAEQAVFRREWIEEATERGATPRGPAVAALDPARYGPDASALAILRGESVRFRVFETRESTSELVDRTEKVLEDEGFLKPERRRKRSTLPDEDLPPVLLLAVDEVGVGAGVHDRLEDEGWRTSGFNGGRSARESDRFFNRRAEAYWLLRNALEDGEIALPDSEELRRELLALRWRATPGGQVQLESKTDLRDRLGRSPDRADALAMALWERRRWMWLRERRAGRGSFSFRSLTMGGP